MDDQLDGLEGLHPNLKPVSQNTDPWFTDGVLRAIDTLAATGRPFTAEHIAELVGEPEHPNQWGPPFALARSRGVIEHHGAIHAHKRSRKGALLNVWIGVPTEVEAA